MKLTINVQSKDLFMTHFVSCHSDNSMRSLATFMLVFILTKWVTNEIF